MLHIRAFRSAQNIDTRPESNHALSVRSGTKAMGFVLQSAMRVYALLWVVAICSGEAVQAQNSDITTNRNAVGLEHNLLFNAHDRHPFDVSVDGPGPSEYLEHMLFDGRMAAFYMAAGEALVYDPQTPSNNVSLKITITGLPITHTQQGAWVGWSTRLWPAKRFKIRGFDVHPYNGDPNQGVWKVLADYESQEYSGNDFVAFLNNGLSGRYTQLEFTFYESSESSGRIGLSELFFIHPEAVRPYEGLLEAGQSADPLWTASDNGISYEDGNVGIGVSDPGERLVVQDRFLVTSDASSTGFAPLGSGSTAAQIYLDTSKGNRTLHIRGLMENNGGDPFHGTLFQSGITNSGGPGGFLFRGASQDLVSFLPNGRVGIGTSSPSALLSLGSASVEGQIAMVNNNPGHRLTWARSDGTQLTGLSSDGFSKMTFLTNGIERMNILQSGHIGIRTANPTHTLTVNGDVAIHRSAGENAVMRFMRDDTEYGAIYTLGGQATPDGNDDLVIRATVDDLKFQTGGSNTRMVIDGTSGSVGIGTTTPTNDAKLHVRHNARQMRLDFDGTNYTNFYSTSTGQLQVDPTGESVYIDGNVGIGTTSPGTALAVNGTVTAGEVVVTNDGWPAWPDYVFEDDYALRSLAEVEAFIAEAGHLPEVPSAAEVAEAGVELGSMQAVLLKKIEELTLYVIALEKETVQQDEALAVQDQQIDRLEAETRRQQVETRRLHALVKQLMEQQ